MREQAEPELVWPGFQKGLMQRTSGAWPQEGPSSARRPLMWVFAERPPGKTSRSATSCPARTNASGPEHVRDPQADTTADTEPTTNEPSSAPASARRHTTRPGRAVSRLSRLPRGGERQAAATHAHGASAFLRVAETDLPDSTRRSDSK